MYSGHRRFGADLGILLLGAGSSQVLAFLAIPVIARLFTPEHFGSAMFFGSAVALLAPVLSLRYEQAIVLPKEDAKARVLTRLPLFLSAAGGLVLLLALVAWDLVAGLEGVGRGLGRWLYVLPLAVLLNVVSLTWGMVRTRDKGFGAISASNMASASSMALTRIGLGSVFGSSVGGLIVGFVAGDLAKAAVLRRGLTGTAEEPGMHSQPVSLRDVAAEYSDFPMYAAPTGVLNRLAASLPVFLLTYLFGPLVVGLYSMTVRMLRGPLEIISVSTRRVFLQRASARIHAGRSFGDLFVWVSLALLGLTAIPLAVLYLLADRILPLILSEEWAGTSKYAIALVPWLLVVVPTAVVNAVFFVRRRLGWLLFLQVLDVAAGMATFASALFMGWGALSAITVYSWVKLGFYAIVAPVALLLSLGIGSGSGDPNSPEAGKLAP